VADDIYNVIFNRSKYDSIMDECIVILNRHNNF